MGPDPRRGIRASLKLVNKGRVGTEIRGLGALRPSGSRKGQSRSLYEVCRDSLGKLCLQISGLLPGRRGLNFEIVVPPPVST